MRRRCCCNSVVTPTCDPNPVTLTTCSDLDCTGGMLIVVHFDIANGTEVTPPCDWSGLSGDYLISNLDGCTPGGSSGASTSRRLEDTNCAITGCVSISAEISVTCDADTLEISAHMTAASTDDGDCDLVSRIGASGSFALPQALGSGTSFTLTPDSVGDDGPVVTACTVTFYGRPCACGTDDCLLPPTASATLERGPFSGVDADILDICDPLDPEIEEQIFAQSCRITVTDTSTANGCPIEKVWLSWDGGFEEFSAPGASLTVSVNDSCGTFEGDLTIIAMDDRGCIDTATIPFSCCGCCTPSGGFSINLDDNVDGIDASNCDQPTDLAPDPCCSWGHQWCYYSLHFDPVEVGDCSAGGLYLVDWGCVQSRDVGTPDICVEPGAEGIDVRVRIDAGCYGECCCIGVTAVNYEGCAAETDWTPLIDNAFCMARDEYDALDPEVFGDCYPLLIPYDCPPV